MIRCDQARILLGSHVLGGLEPHEGVEVEAHLAGCTACREALERIAPLPGLLDALEPDKPLDATPSSHLEGAVLAEFAAHSPAAGVRRHGRLRRWPLAGAGVLAGSVATIVALALGGAFSSGRADETRVTLVSPAGAAEARAQARLVTTSAGTEIVLDADLPKLREGEVYELWFGGEDGIASAGTFTVDVHGWAEVRLTTAARAGRYTRLGITREPDALDPARNGTSVAGAALPG